MKMFFTSILKFCTSCYLSAAFQSIIGCFSTGPPVLGITCTDLAMFIGFLACVTAIIFALAVSMTAFVIAHIMFH